MGNRKLRRYRCVSLDDDQEINWWQQSFTLGKTYEGWEGEWSIFDNSKIPCLRLRRYGEKESFEKCFHVPISHFEEVELTEQDKIDEHNIIERWEIETID